MDGFEEAKQQEFNRLQAENAQLLRDIETYRKRADYAAQSQATAHAREGDALARAEAAEDRERTALRERDEARAKYNESVGVWKSRVEFDAARIALHQAQRNEQQASADLACERMRVAEADCTAIQQMCHDALEMVAGSKVEVILRDIVSGRFSGSPLLERLRAAEAGRDEANARWRATSDEIKMWQDRCRVVEDERERLRSLYADCAEAWKTASGLSVDGDHDGVTPEMLAADLARREREMSAAVAVVEAARPMLEPAGHKLRVPQLDVLEDALAAYDALGAKGEAVRS